MGSITNDRDRTENKKYIGIRILAVLFWIAVWQIASMWLGQEILLASPVSVIRRLFELIFTGDFWHSAGFSFGRIVLGFSMALILGILLAVLAFLSRTVEILVNPVLTAVKSTPVASFIILCLIWIPSRNLSVFISFLMVLPVIYTNILEGIRQTDRADPGDGEGVSGEHGKADQIYLCITDIALFCFCLQAFPGYVLEGRSGSRGDRSTQGFYRRKALQCQDLSGDSGSFCLDNSDHSDQLCI